MAHHITVNVSFALDIDAAEWLGATVDTSDPAVVQRVGADVRCHAESVVRDLYRDQGWIDDEVEETFEQELSMCCGGRNINCGHHWGRGR